jgi:hypothetical protein
MKMKSLILAGVVSLGLTGLVNAASVVYITGSTAARAAFHATLVDGASVFDAAPTVVFQGAGSATLVGTADIATYVSYSGNVGGVATVLKAHWSGSEGGIADLANGTSEAFLDDTATTTTDGSAPGPFVNSPVQLAAADNDKAFSKNPAAAITGVKVCVIPFKFEKEVGSSASLVNVTDQAFRNAIKSGNAKLALFTGNAADTTRVFIAGRDNNSGTRVNVYGDTGFGIFSTPKQIKINSDGSINSFGNIGESSGGTLAKAMAFDLSQATSVDTAPGGDGVSHFSVFTYVGLTDAATAESLGATALTYNGVPYSVANVEEGRYNLWGNEFVYRLNSGLSTEATTIFNKLTGATGISGHADDTVTIKLTSMHATRTGPTADPVHN